MTHSTSPVVCPWSWQVGTSTFSQCSGRGEVEAGEERVWKKGLRGASQICCALVACVYICMCVCECVHVCLCVCVCMCVFEHV